MKRLAVALVLLTPGWAAAQDGTLGQVLAHSAPDWSLDGVQGEHGWHYGWYDQRADVERGDGRYSTGEFVPFRNDGSGLPTPANQWNGQFWHLLEGGSTDLDTGVQLRASGGRPAASASAGAPVRWAVRRWRSDVEEEVEVEAILTNDGAGDGVVGRVFHNGTELHALSSDGVTDIFVASIVLRVGDTLDFALDADGSGNLAGAGIDHIDGAGDECHQVLRVRRLRPPEGDDFVRGDSDGNGTINITDGVRTLNWLFTGGPTPPCLDAADFDDSGDIDISDGLGPLWCLFLWDFCDFSCGPDSTPDFLPTCSYPTC